jgi:hypothetical protein
VENEDGNPNVYALFPGIDTAPFGAGTAEDPGDVDDGWSAVPARTVAADEIAAPADNARAHAKLFSAGLHRRTPAIGLGVALLAGAALAVAHAAISPAHREPRLAAEHAMRGSHGDLAQVVGKLFQAARIKPERTFVGHRSARHAVRVRNRRLHRSWAAPVRTATVTSPSPAPSAPVPQQPPPQYATTARSSGSEDSSSVVRSSPSSTAQRAGPSGPVSLIGAGTTPSG